MAEALHSPRPIAAPLDRLAEVLIRYSTQIRPGELVSLVGPSSAEALLLALYREVLLARGQPLLRMTPEGCEELLYRHGSPEQLAFLSPLEVRELEVADVIIYVLTSLVTPELAHVEPARQAQHHRPRLPLLRLFRQRTEMRVLRWVAVQFPGPAAARDAGLSLAEYQQFFWRASLLDRPDPVAAWRSLGERQAHLADYLQAVRELHIITREGTDLRVAVPGRRWINCAGQENFPDGEVFTAPLDGGTEGVACFPWPMVYAGREMQEIRLVFQAGRVVNASASSGEDVLHGLLNLDGGARIPGEVALGCNYAIDRPTRNTLLDEKIGGAFHIALGAAYPQTGGNNQSGLHWDLVGDLRQGGRVEADGRVISDSGRFTDPAWPQPEG
jgi:aminopeptidase